MHEHQNHNAHNDMVLPKTNAKEYAKLLGILLFLSIAALGPSTIAGFDAGEWMRWFMGGFFIVFGSFKLIGYEMFIIMFPGYDILAKKYKFYAWAYPFIEVFLGSLYVLNLMSIFRDVSTIAITAIGSIGIISAIRRSGPIQCACLGNVIRLPLSTVTLIEDLGMLIMAVVMLLSTLFL